MTNIQDQFNATKSGDFVLVPGEYEGPLVIDRPCVFDGAGATLWANAGPVLQVASEKVQVKNLRIEVTGTEAAGEADVALKTTYAGTKLENVEVKGVVVGLPQESEAWQLPGMLSLGNFAAETENTFSIELQAAASAQLECAMRDIRLSPQALAVGKNVITLTTAELRNNTILYGEIIVKTAVNRRIYIMGKAQAGAPVHSEGTPVSDGPAVSLPVQMEAPREMIAPNVSDANVQQVKRGQRLSIKDLQDDVLKIAFEYQTDDANLEIDGYCFLLQENNIVRQDEDLIFFGNQESRDGAVRMGQNGERPLVLVEPAKAAPDVNRIAVCYSIYGDNQMQRFSAVRGAVVRIFSSDKEVYRFALDELHEEKTAVAVELYRYKGEWKMSFVGAGYRSGLRHLCEGYGVNIE